YKAGAQGNTEVLAGQIKTEFANLPSQLQSIKSGKLHALAVTSAKRSSELPNVPTVSESGYPGFEVTVWYGLCAPAKTPENVVAALEKIVVKTLSMPDLQ